MVIKKVQILNYFSDKTQRKRKDNVFLAANSLRLENKTTDRVYPSALDVLQASIILLVKRKPDL